MRNVLYGLLAFLLIAGLACAATAVAETGDNDDDHHHGMVSDDSPDDSEHECLGVFACPMFCDEFMTTDPEAKCPSCNMNVTRVDELYVCPDHPDEFSMDPKSVCVDTDKEFVEVEQLYVCPMHPEVISADPDASCSICGMDLKQVAHPENCEHHKSGESETHSCSHSCGGHSS